jgi:hypothetical protein
MGNMKHEYHEGPKAGENFKKLATAVFKAPKVANPKRQPKPASGSDKGQQLLLLAAPNDPLLRCQSSHAVSSPQPHENTPQIVLPKFAD